MLNKRDVVVVVVVRDRWWGAKAAAVHVADVKARAVRIEAENFILDYRLV